MDQIELAVASREVVGKKVRFLRRQGIVPVHLFGHGVKSVALQCDTAHLQRTLAKAGQTRLVALKIDNEKRPRSTVVREIQREPQTGELLHVDFYQVKMAEKVRIEVPIIPVGESPALKSKGNTLMQELNTLTVECLPAKIPNAVELDLSILTETDQAVRVKDIKLDKEISVLNDPELMVASISVQSTVDIEAPPTETPEATPSPEEESTEE